MTKKEEYNRKMKEYEKQLKTDEEELNEIANAEEKKRIEKFISTEKNIVSTAKIGGKIPEPGPSTSTISNMSNGKHKQLPSFWAPSETPDAKRAKIDKPDKTIYCPISGKPMKLKDLIDIKFTPVSDDEKDPKSIITKEARYKCPVTHDILSNSIPCAVLKPTGDVVTMECVEKLIKKDWIHPLTNEKLKESDIIPLQRGGTGYATTNESLTLTSKSYRPALQA